MADALIPTPEESPESWNYMRIGKFIAPGRVKDVQQRRAHDVDKPKPGGKNGFAITTNGEKPMDVSITLELWEDDLDEVGRFSAWMQELRELIQLLFPDGDALPSPQDVTYPLLSFHNLRSLFFEEVDGPKITGTNRIEVTFKCANFQRVSKVKNVTNTPKTSAPITGGGSVLDGKKTPFGPPPPPNFVPPTMPDALPPPGPR